MKTTLRVLTLLWVILLLFGGLSAPGIAQQSTDLSPGPPPENDFPPGLPMQSILYHLDRFTEKDAPSIAQTTAKYHNAITLDEAGRVHVEIVGQPGMLNVPPELVTRLDGLVTNTWRHRLEAWVPPNLLIELAQSLPAGYFLQAASRPSLDEVVGEGPAAANSDEYRDNDANCSGLTIAVIDSQFTDLTSARANGDAPPFGNTTTINYTPTAFESGGTHGTGATEAVFDHCPGATYRLYKIDSLTDLGTAVDNAQSNGVDIITHSLSWYNTGWADDSGDACAAAEDAANSGILFFTSAGNRAQQHWEGTFRDTDSDNWHEWTTLTADELLAINIPAGGTARFYLQWDTSGGTFNYDLHLYDAGVTTVLASSTNAGNTFEELSWTNTSGSAVTVNLTVFKVSGGNTTMEVFNYGSGIWTEHIVAAGSNTSPSNCTHPEIISVGAVDHSDFSSASGTTGILMDYSSRGPSNSGMTLPDIAGPTNTTSFTYPGGFGGTSAATPNTAGAAGALWSSSPTLTASSIRHLLFKMATIFKDWGSTGKDNLYGTGGVHLYDYHVNTVWVDRSGVQEDTGLVLNLSGTTSYPYYYVVHAQEDATAGGRVVFLGGAYPEAITLNKQLRYETIGGVAQIGE